ncbi:TIGR03084 family metal-binding protein [Aeromicrobium sp. CF3.5]|uniref:TIGR03084 family metal-binding protein n=1 Tax=Aeromicrobium sp. CF3.5 TaxID=3373078 RepID=UPI003EE54316
MSVLEEVLADLGAESEQLDGWVSELPDGGPTDEGWRTVTTPEGWTVAHQVAHLHWTDSASIAAIAGGTDFETMLATASTDPTGFVDAEAERLAQTPPAELLTAWRRGRADLAEVLREVPDGVKIAWFGPPMSPTSMATARFMETWAHSQDVAEALGVDVPRTDRVRHVCHLGVRTRGFAYLMRGLDVPDAEIRVELDSPGGETWTWGPEDAPDRVTGDGWDFALLAARRRHRDDVDVRAFGAAADEWLDLAQTFAGLPGNDPLRLDDRPAGRGRRSDR